MSEDSDTMLRIDGQIPLFYAKIAVLIQDVTWRLHFINCEYIVDTRLSLLYTKMEGIQGRNIARAAPIGWDDKVRDGISIQGMSV